MNFDDRLALEHERLAPAYAERFAQHPALAAYPTLPALVAKLTRSPKRLSKAKVARLRRERAALLCVLLDAYQQRRDRLSEALVLTATTPMREIVRRRFTGADGEEREGLFLAGVSLVLATVDPRNKPEKMCGIVWMKTKKRVSPKLRKEKAWAEVGVDVEADDVPDETVPGHEEYLLIDIASEAHGGEMARARVPVDVLDLPVRRIQTYVGRQFGCLPASDRRAIFERLRGLQKRGRKLEGKAVTRTSRRPEVAPDSQTRLRGPVENARALEVAS